MGSAGRSADVADVSAGISMEQVKRTMRSAWTAGDFGVVAKTIARDAEAFVQKLGLPAGSRVLDVACGTGNLAIPLARGGCVVTGVDIAPNLLQQGRERAAAERLEVQFDEGDAEQLPYDGGSFDAVVSMFGAMFAPRPEVVTAEFERVLRPGGLLAMANWTPESFSGQMFQVSAKHGPPPTPGVSPPVLWGDEPTVRARLESGFANLRTRIVPIQFNMPMNAAGAVTFFRTYFGPTQVAFARLDHERQEALRHDLEALWAGANRAPDPENSVTVENEYLFVRGTRR